MRKKQLPATERLRLKLEVMGHTLKPEYIRRLSARDRNAEWWTKVPRDAPDEDRWGQNFCSYYTVAQLAKDGVEIEVEYDVGYRWLHVKKAKAQP